MNDAILLKGQFLSGGRLSGGGFEPIPSKERLCTDKIRRLISELAVVIDFWEKDTFGINPLIRVEYIKIVPKSHRMRRILKVSGRECNDLIAGAEISESSPFHHIITYSVPIFVLKTSVSLLRNICQVIDSEFNSIITAEDANDIRLGKRLFHSRLFTKTGFLEIISDCYYIESFSVRTKANAIKGNRLVSFYRTGLSSEELSRKLGISPFGKLDDDTWHLKSTEIENINKIAPYLISMSVRDFSQYSLLPENTYDTSSDFIIPDPDDEPVIGVIDTLFDEEAYFSKWVEFHNELSSEIETTSDDYVHGTEVSSLIVDGPALNHHLDDGCGRFRVRHFGIAKATRMDSLQIVRDIDRIVRSNQDIKVWNLSLGSVFEISRNSISPEAAVLDRLQYELDVIFTISGTNNGREDHGYPFIGAPADSLNSLIVNSISPYSDEPVSYSRKGPVLNFFTKPDVSVPGGIRGGDEITVYSPRGIVRTYGTSFAAPWIARKLAYLIHIMNIPREAAKAMLIDAAAGWNTDRKWQDVIGYGRVPVRIEDIIKCSDDEIRFIVSGISQDYETSAYNIPVPVHNGVHPFAARFTMCYFPHCSRNQGVDYTDTELSIQFGRLNNGRIESIDKNQQGDSNKINLSEEKARKEFCKWANVKHVAEKYSERSRSKKMYGSGLWGVIIRRTERLDNDRKKPLHFSIVVTLKNIDGENLSEQFIRLCRAHNWFTEKLDQKVFTELYAEANEEVEFE